MLEREVIGIDHGNRNMKTVHTDFSAAITKLEVRPDNLENVLEFQGQCFKIGEGAPELETVDKTQNMNYYHLTLAALAKELHYRGKTEALVRIGAALPPRRYGLQKNDFKKYLLQSKNLKFRYEGRNYHVEIENAHIFMRGHVIVLLHQEELMGECVLCDMGGGTNDIMGLVDGKPTGQLFIDKNAALTCINHIREVVEAKTGETISTYALEKFMVNGDYDCSDAYRNIIQGELKQYAEQIYLILKKFGYNLDLTKIVEVGYKFRPEFIIDQGYMNNTYRIPSKEFKDFQAFQRREVAKLAKEMVDITHECGKEAMMFLGDHWIGMEPFMDEFKTDTADT